MKKVALLIALTLGLIIIGAINVYATNYSYVEGTQTVSLGAGMYTIEIWGQPGQPGANMGYATGGPGGAGGYAKGTVISSGPITLYIIGSSGSETVRLNVNDSANNILTAGIGGNGTDGYDDGATYWADGDPGTPGTGWASPSLAYPSSGSAFGGPLAKVTQVPAIMSISTPTTNQIYSSQTGTTTITITGKVAAYVGFSGGSVTMSATIGGKTKTQVVSPVPSSPPGGDNFTLTWDVVTDNISPGAYTAFSNVSVTANDGAGGIVSTTLSPTLTVDNASPTVNAATTTNVQSTYIVVHANASDVSTPIEYLFNIGGVDQGTWQTSNAYSFTSLSPSTTYTIKYKARDKYGNTSNYSATINVATCAATYYNYYEGTMSTSLVAGTYTIETWGSKGSDGASVGYATGGIGGSGGYAKGTLTLASPATLYLIGSTGTETIRLNTNSSANNLAVGGGGGNGTDGVDDGATYWADGDPGTPGVGSVYAPLTSTSTSTGVNNTVGKIRIAFVSGPNNVPSISITNPSAAQSITTVGVVTIIGTVTDPDPSQTITISAVINSVSKTTTVATPAASSAWSLSWTGSEIGVGSYPADITVTANDANGGTSAGTYTGDITVTTPPPAVGTVTIVEVRDLYNNNNASDIRVIFKGATDESKIVSYKVIVAKTSGVQPTDGVNSSLITEATNTVTGNYVSESLKGKGRMHLFILPSQLQTYDNQTINAAAGDIKVYVLSIAKMGNSDKLTLGVDLTSGDNTGHSLSSNNDGNNILAPLPLAADLSNIGNGMDIRVIFRKPKSEVNIQEYRIIVSTATLNLTMASAVPSVGYKSVTPTSTGIGYSVRMGAAQTIDDGVTTIQNGTAYKIYILVVGKNGYANKLSTPSRTITLSQYVPGVYAVRGLSAVKVGTGHESSNIKVTFYEPTKVSDIQEYRILIVPSGTNMTVTAAEGATLASMYQIVAVSSRFASHVVTLDAGKSDYVGTALVAGDYKVYVLVIGQNGYADKLVGTISVVKLD